MSSTMMRMTLGRSVAPAPYKPKTQAKDSKSMFGMFFIKVVSLRCLEPHLNGVSKLFLTSLNFSVKKGFAREEGKHASLHFKATLELDLAGPILAFAA